MVSPFQKAKHPFAPTKTTTDQQASPPEKPKPENEEEETISLASVENPAADKEGLLSSDKTGTHGGFDLRPLAAAKVTASTTTEIINREETEKADEWWEPKAANLEEKHEINTEEDLIEHEEIEEELIEIEDETDSEQCEFEDPQRLDSTYDVPCDDVAFTEEQSDNCKPNGEKEEEDGDVDYEEGDDDDMDKDTPIDVQCTEMDSLAVDSTTKHWDPTAFWRQLDTNFVVPTLDDDERIGLSCSMDEMTDDNDDEHLEADSLKYMQEVRDDREDDTDYMSKQDEVNALLEQCGIEGRVSYDDDDTSFASVADSLVLTRPNYQDQSSVLSNDSSATTTTDDSSGNFGRNFVVQTHHQQHDQQMTESSLDNTPTEWTSVTLSPVGKPTEKSIEWTRPEWTKQQSLRSVQSASSKPKTNTTTWEKPIWMHASPLRKTDRGAALRSGKEITRTSKLPLPMDVDESDHE